MADVVIEVDGVWKKFRRGEFHDSLRDAVPAAARWLLRRRSSRSDLGKGDFWALQDVSFKLERGQALGIIGPNGAGKSTMLKILSRILRPNRGTVRVNGQLNALIEVSAGFHNDLTGRENVFLNGSILGMRRREIARKFDDIVEFSGLAPFIDTPVKRYSSGMKARLGFSVAANLDPDILLVDEVLSVGDAAFRTRCLERMQELRELGVTLMFISHNIDQITRLCPKTMLLVDGFKTFEGPSEEAAMLYSQACRSQVTKVRDVSGIAQVKLVGIRIETDETSDARAATPRRPLVIEFEIDSEVDLENFYVAGSLRVPGRETLLYFDSRNDDWQFHQNAGRGVVRLSFVSFPLARGDYDLSVQFIDGNGTELARFLNAYRLVVSGGQAHIGSVDVPIEWAHIGTEGDSLVTNNDRSAVM